MEDKSRSPIDAAMANLGILTGNTNRVPGRVADGPTNEPGQTELSYGVKYDADKTPYHLISPTFLEGLALVLKHGAIKYSPRNWEKGMEWSRVYRAAIGHMNDWWMSRGPDPETRLSHLLHAACCLMMLYEYEVLAKGKDDRPYQNKTEVDLITHMR